MKAEETKKCIWCGEPATTQARLFFQGSRYPACDLCAAQTKRKNLYMPCAIHADLDQMTPEEHVRVIKATYWADNITNREWPVVLSHEDAKKDARSKLKKKAVGWLMALSRILYLNPKLGGTAMRAADKLYREQIKEDPPLPWALLADLIEQGWTADSLEAWLRPLRNLRSFGPNGLEALAQHLADAAEAEEWEALPEKKAA